MKVTLQFRLIAMALAAALAAEEDHDLAGTEDDTASAAAAPLRQRLQRTAA
jgi:hypothetical protein